MDVYSVLPWGELQINAFVANLNKFTGLLALFVLSRVLIALVLFCMPCLPLLYRVLSLHQRALAAARGIILSTADHFFTLAHCFSQGITSCVLISHFTLWLSSAKCNLTVCFASQLCMAEQHANVQFYIWH